MSPADSAPEAQTRRTRLFRWLNDPEDPHWERPAPTRAQRRNDLLSTVLALAVGLLMVMFAKSFGMVVEGEAAWRAYLAVALMVLPLAIRRAFPLITLVLASILFLALSYLSPEAATSMTFQVAYFTALYSAVAWAQERRALWILNVLVLVEMAVWLTISFTLTNAFTSGDDLFEDASGPMAPLPAYVLYTAVMNFAYFVGAMLIGRNSWRGALERDRADAHGRQLAEQAEELARRAVVDERIRIARELHDVVAHHVSVIGIQAGAARRVMNRSAEQAAAALRTVESASREAVAEMRSLLKVLRSDDESDADGSRLPEPGLADVDALARSHAASGVRVSVNRVEHAPGALAEIPAPLALSAYRCIQESLTNVHRHSTATTAQVTIRTGAGEPTGWLEVEILDAGRPRPGTSGTGYGLRGITERATLHQGVVDMGPRAHQQGWRVRVRFPLTRQPLSTGAAEERTLA